MNSDDHHPEQPHPVMVQTAQPTATRVIQHRQTRPSNSQSADERHPWRRRTFNKGQVTLAPLVGLVERLTQQTVEQAGRIAQLELENEQLRALTMSPTPELPRDPEPPRAWWAFWRARN